ncbi:hypothetical protein [Metabacillus sp. Hm71]|uniref:hypothetical protein n=1 Tax=Metabacillus sp. Hm71 TaxID=3450743 RepID=UPI003F43FBD9
MDKTEELVQEMLGRVLSDAQQEAANLLIDLSGSITPIISSLWTSYKIGKLKKRLDIVEPELRKIKEMLDKKENDLFYKQEVFPLILKYIHDEDEDEKVNIYINGFKHTVDEDIEDMEKIYHFYDVLAQLRISDIVRLCKKFVPGKKLKLDTDFPDIKRYEEDQEYREELREKEDIEVYIDNKLIRLGIVKVIQEDPLEKLTKGMQGRTLTRSRSKTEYKLSSFGRRFVNFFAVED